MNEDIITFILLILTFLIIFAIGIFGKEENREIFFRVIKKKKTWVITSIIVLAPFVLYPLITIMLMAIRGDCFTAQHVYIGDHYFISYNDDAYVEFSNSDEINKMYDEVEGAWSEEKRYVVKAPVEFPYIQYWYPDIMLEQFKVSQDGEYLVTFTMGGQRNYRRFEE